MFVVDVLVCASAAAAKIGALRCDAMWGAFLNFHQLRLGKLFFLAHDLRRNEFGLNGVRNENSLPLLASDPFPAEGNVFGGKGVGREQGKAIFVPYTIEAELVSAEIVREKKQFAESELVEVKESSPHRVTPKCPYFGRCGGCAYQHIDYEHQLAIKWRQVRNALQRIGKLKDVPMRPIIPSPRQYAYRNRITVHAQEGVIGFFRRDSHQLIDIEHCPISTDEVNRAMTELRAQMHVRDGHYTLRASS